MRMLVFTKVLVYKFEIQDGLPTLKMGNSSRIKRPEKQRANITQVSIGFPPPAHVVPQQPLNFLPRGSVKSPERSHKCLQRLWWAPPGWQYHIFSVPALQLGMMLPPLWIAPKSHLLFGSSSQQLLNCLTGAAAIFQQVTLGVTTTDSVRSLKYNTEVLLGGKEETMSSPSVLL